MNTMTQERTPGAAESLARATKAQAQIEALTLVSEGIQRRMDAGGLMLADEALAYIEGAMRGLVQVRDSASALSAQIIDIEKE